MKMFQLSRHFFFRKSFINHISFSSILTRELCCDASIEDNKSKNPNYLLILDFEATCDKVKMQQEIIEFPCLKINLKTAKEESRFHYYIKPVINPILSIFCTELTGIIQEMVENEKTFPDVLNSFGDWRLKEGLTSQNSLYLTSGDWDLGYMLPRQCSVSQIEIPSHMMEWIDIKKLYGNNFNNYSNSLTDIMKAFNLEFEGRAHSGIDDCLNIYKIVKKLINLGITFTPTSKLEITEMGTKVHNYGARKYVPFTVNKRLKPEMNK